MLDLHLSLGHDALPAGCAASTGASGQHGSRCGEGAAGRCQLSCGSPQSSDLQHQDNARQNGHSDTFAIKEKDKTSSRLKSCRS